MLWCCGKLGLFYCNLRIESELFPLGSRLPVCGSAKMMTVMPTDRESTELLRAIVRRPSEAEPIEPLAEKIRDWSSLLKLAEEQKVIPQLYLRLAEMISAVPPEAQEQLQIAYQRNVFHSLANAAELISALKAFDEEKIPAMPFKGVVLAATAYHDLSSRPAGDLDLLVYQGDLVRATEVLVKRGYELKTRVLADGTPEPSNSYEYHFERQSDGMVMELRWRLELTQPRFRRNLGMDWVWPQRRVTMLAGAAVPGMSPEVTLLVLCMHGCKHAWSRLIWIRDVAQHLESHSDLDWNTTAREAKRTGLWRALALGVLLAHRMAGALVPDSMLRRFASDSTAHTLALHFEENLFDSPGITPPSWIPYSIQLLGFRDRVRLMSSLSFLRPNQRDRAFVQLPKGLHGLYYVIRPFRILKDRSAR